MSLYDNVTMSHFFSTGGEDCYICRERNNNRVTPLSHRKITSERHEHLVISLKEQGDVQSKYIIVIKLRIITGYYVSLTFSFTERNIYCL